MGFKTGVPQLNHLAVMASNASTETIGITFGFTVLSFVFFLLRFLKQSNKFPEISSIDSAAGLDFKNGRTPQAYQWTKLLQQASEKVHHTRGATSY